MDKAFYGEHGLVSLAEFFRYEYGTDPRNRDKNYTTAPLCKACGEPVEVYDKFGQLGIKAVGRQLTQRRLLPGFYHDIADIAKNCPSGIQAPGNLQKFVSVNQFDYRTRGRAQELFENSQETLVMRANRHILTRLMIPLSGATEISLPDQKILYSLYKLIIDRLEGIEQVPWLVPFLQAHLYGAHQRYRPDGKSYKSYHVRYLFDLKKSLAIQKWDGSAGQIIVPHILTARFYYPRNGQYGHALRGYDPVEVSQKFAQRILILSDFEGLSPYEPGASFQQHELQKVKPSVHPNPPFLKARQLSFLL